jgi:hypothetical protein
MTSNQALFSSYALSAKESALHAVELGHKLSGQLDKAFYEALAECQAAVRHLNSAIEKLQPAVNAELMSDLEIDC